MMRRAPLALAITLSLGGCQLPPDAPPARPVDLAGSITFDGGIGDGDIAARGVWRLGGNTLPLDGGVPLAELVLTVRDSETDLPLPARVIFRPVPGAGFADSITSGMPDPDSNGSRVGTLVSSGVLGSNEGVLLAGGAGVVPVPPGRYTLVFTRGPEYELEETTVTVQAGERQAIHARLDHSVDTRGWVAADMHVHLKGSFDAALLAERRVVSMVTGGVELVVATDHNVNTSLLSATRTLGYGHELLGTIVGDEFSFLEGHGGAFPVPFHPWEPYGGAPPYQAPNADGICEPPVIGINCLTAAVAFPLMHALVPGVTVVTVNHPYWPDGDLGYFTNIGWGSGTTHPLPAVLDTAPLFDALEVLNGYQLDARPVRNLIADWFYLLGQGHRITAVGNSDTHRINWVRGGFPRTWVRLPDDLPGDNTGAELAEAIRKGRAVASTGPFVTLTVDGAQIGDTVVPRQPGQITVNLTVDAPTWVHVDTVRLYIDGQERRSVAVPAGQRPVFQAAWNEPLTKASASGDSWVVAVATGSDPLPPDIVGEYSDAQGYGMPAIALTNPVFVDANGDGMWNPAPVSAQDLEMHALLREQPAHRSVRPAARCEDEDSSAALETPAHYLLPLLDP